ncbi:hypothetical protein BJX99DRAFT_224670 [Aspergillus californicus]
MLVVLLVAQISDTWWNGKHVYFKCAIGDFQVDIRGDFISFLTVSLVPILVVYGTYDVIRLLYSRNGVDEPDEVDNCYSPMRRLKNVGMADLFLECITS